MARERELTISVFRALFISLTMYGGAMITLENEVDVKIKALCEAIAADPVVISAGSKIDDFSADTAAQDLYKSVQEKGSELQYRQQVGLEVSETELGEFDAARETLMQNDKVKAFMESQQILSELHKKLTQYISLTIETGEVPTEEDVMDSMNSGCCGGSGGESGGCGC